MGQTAYTVFSVLSLLFILMYIFAVLGFSLFGTTGQGDPSNWGNLAGAFFTLFSLATVLYVGAVGWGRGLEPAPPVGGVCGRAGRGLGPSAWSGT